AGGAPAAVGGGDPVPAPLAGNIWKVEVQPGQQVAEGDVIVILEAMKMEVQVSAPVAGTVQEIKVAKGDMVQTGDELATIG
ncbi:MAG: biotin/lipoyl-binding carrier protein, partial [Planctomycetota bacterium]|nr:biotin/lipoyl-binding carrier protein [Planctomycetota bacterium]